MAIVLIPLAVSALGGLGYYLYPSTSKSNFDEVVKEIKKADHPIIQKLEVKHTATPALDDIKQRRSALRKVGIPVRSGIYPNPMDSALQERKGTLKHVETRVVNFII